MAPVTLLNVPAGHPMRVPVNKGQNDPGGHRSMVYKCTAYNTAPQPLTTDRTTANELGIEHASVKEN
jgi:hypothetical protein